MKDRQGRHCFRTTWGPPWGLPVEPSQTKSIGTMSWYFLAQSFPQPIDQPHTLRARPPEPKVRTHRPMQSTQADVTQRSSVGPSQCNPPRNSKPGHQLVRNNWGGVLSWSCATTCDCG